MTKTSVTISNKLAAGMGVTVEVETLGEREQEALVAIVALMNDKFGEGE